MYASLLCVKEAHKDCIYIRNGNMTIHAFETSILQYRPFMSKINDLSHPVNSLHCMHSSFPIPESRLTMSHAASFKLCSYTNSL